jgi:membrane-associated phospholipid phosphatase
VKHYRFIDYATQGYMGIVGLLVLLAHNETVPEWPYLVAGHVVFIGLVHLLIRAHGAGHSARWMDLLRHFYPVLLYIGFYRETGALNQMFVTDYQDPWFIRLEHHLFGQQPCLVFMESLPYLPVSEVFYASYFSYYLMIAGVGLALFLRERRQFFHYVSVVSFVFYICYLVYIRLPVMGPRCLFREVEGYRLPDDVQTLVGYPTFPAAVQAGLFYHLMAFIYRYFEGAGAAFPSSHVAVALCTVYFSFRYLPKFRYVHLALALLLCLSTVYCRYHYAVDVFGGALTAVLLVPLANWLYFKFERLG